MQNLLDFIARHFHWLLFLLLEVVSGVMFFSYNSYQGSVWFTTANAVSGTMLGWRSNVEQFFHLKRVNEELSGRNVVLEQQLRIYREQMATTAPDASPTSLDSVSSLSPASLIAAKVVANTIDQPDNLMTIDRGRADGVEPDMGVISGMGVVGVVFTAGEHYSIVLPVLNVRSRISCSIRGRDYFGYLTWQASASPIEAYVEDIPRHAKFRKGDWVETSGYSSIFPKGIVVGKIIAIYNSADGLSYSLKVHLATDFACLRDVFVISDKSFIEQRELLEQARDSLDTNSKKF